MRCSSSNTHADYSFHVPLLPSPVQLYIVYIARCAHRFGVARTREIYESSIKHLPDHHVKSMCLKYASLEKKLGEVDRARAIYQYGAQFCDPRIEAAYWNTWSDFEVSPFVCFFYFFAFLLSFCIFGVPRTRSSSSFSPLSIAALLFSDRKVSTRTVKDPEIRVRKILVCPSPHPPPPPSLSLSHGGLRITSSPRITRTPCSSFCFCCPNIRSSVDSPVRLRFIFSLCWSFYLLSVRR